MIPAGYELLAIPVFIVGILLLYKGSDILVEGTSKTAAAIGVSSIIISVIIVAFGTSAPELAISTGAAVQNQPAISIGNIIGSIIANLLLVLGISAIIKPIPIKDSTIKRDFPIMLLSAFIFVVFSYFGLLDGYHFIGGFLFLCFFVMFIYFFYKCAKKERKNEKRFKTDDLKKNILFIIFGIIGVVIGAQLLIESSVTIANFFGVPEIIIALSLVAIGTSLPELVVSAVASYKDESDIAIGNVIGSNVFNIFLVIGVAALIIPLNAVDSMSHLLILIVICIVMYPILKTNNIISKKKGIFLLIMYCIFIWYTFFGYKIIMI